MSDNTFDNLQEKLEALKHIIDSDLLKNEIDDIKAKYSEPKEPSDKAKEFKVKMDARVPTERPLASQIAELKEKYRTGEEEKQKSFQEKIDAIKRKYKTDK